MTAKAVPLLSSMTRANNVAFKQLYTQATALHEQTPWRLLAPAQDPFRQHARRAPLAGPAAAKAVARGRTDICQIAGAPGRPNRVCAHENTKTHDEPLPYRNSTASLIHEAAYISTHNFFILHAFFFVVCRSFLGRNEAVAYVPGMFDIRYSGGSGVGGASDARKREPPILRSPYKLTAECEL